MMEDSTSVRVEWRRASKDPAYMDFPCIIIISHIHNHLLASSESLSWRDPAPEVKEKFLKLFTECTPSEALERHKRDLMIEHGDNYHKVVADRAVCPNRMWVYHLYYKSCKAGYCKMREEEEDVIPKLLESVAAYNCRLEHECAKVEANDDYIAVAICSPLMQRVHSKMPSAAELVCMDTSAHIARIQCHVYLLMTHSDVGGLPLGALITSSDSEEVLNEALSLFKDILPEKAFYNRGSEGPAVLVTGDSPSLRKSLHFAFPQSVGILGIYPLLEDVWRLIWDPETGVRDEDKIPLFSVFKLLMKSESADQLEKNFEMGAGNLIVTRYDKTAVCYQNLFSKRIDWAPCFRRATMECGNEADSLSEIAFAVLRDKVLLRTKASNVAQLFCFLSGELDTYYKRKVLQMIAGRAESRARQGFIGFGSGKKRQTHAVLDTDATLVFRVQGEVPGEEWLVDSSTWNCSCPVGLSSGACQHQFAVSGQRSLDPKQLVLTEAVMDVNELRYIATGQKSTDVGSECSIDIDPDIVTTDIVEISPDEVTNEQRDYLTYPHEVPVGILQRFHQFCDKIESELSANPGQFTPALRHFLDRFESLTTSAELVSGLENFGQCSSDMGPQSGNRKRKRSFDSSVNGSCTVQRLSIRDDRPLNGSEPCESDQTCLSTIKYEHNYCS